MPSKQWKVLPQVLKKLYCDAGLFQTTLVNGLWKVWANKHGLTAIEVKK